VLLRDSDSINMNCGKARNMVLSAINRTEAEERPMMEEHRAVAPRKTLSSYLDGLQRSGIYTFAREDAIQALQCTSLALKRSAQRLEAKARLVAPRRGFFVIVPIEYSSAGVPPPSWFIDALMEFHGQPYYVGLLSAAAQHGAAHQQPQEFQVVTSLPLRPIAVGRARIRFFAKRSISNTPTQEVKTETGIMRTSTPEATAFDLLRYVHGVGGLGNVATVLAELKEAIQPERLVSVAKAEDEPAHAQRLGYLLDFVGGKRQTGPLAKWLATRRPLRVPLRPGKSVQGFPLNRRWQVTVNEQVESDL
jgi:predicted transcriptional regulator of viral defense system